MAVGYIEEYRQQNGTDILKVILKPTEKFPNSYFYADACDEELVRSYTWYWLSQKQPYVITDYQDYHMGKQHRNFHREKAFNILGYYPDYINHT